MKDMKLKLCHFKDNYIRHIFVKFQVITIITSLIMHNYVYTGVKIQSFLIQNDENFEL